MDTQAARPRWRFNASLRLTPRLQAGLEYNASAGEWTPTANWVAIVETDRQPTVSFGTSSDRIFSPQHTQAYFVTAAKTLPGGRIAPYVGLSYSEWEETVLFPFGVNYVIAPQLDLLVMNDGRNSHLLLTHKEVGTSVSLLLIKLETLGISIGFGF